MRTACWLFLAVATQFMAGAQVTSDALLRVFAIQLGNSFGTSFYIEVDGQQYLITARHVVKDVKRGGAVRLRNPNTLQWEDAIVDDVIERKGEDVVALLTTKNEPELKKYKISLGASGLILGQEIFFLGYPYGFDVQTEVQGSMYLIPFVKRATVSAFATLGGVKVLLLDGFNNPGFSGGPVVSYDSRKRETSIVGVISGYRNELRPVKAGANQTPFTVETNTGIIICYPLGGILDSIRQNPSGRSQPTRTGQ